VYSADFFCKILISFIKNYASPYEIMQGEYPRADQFLLGWQLTQLETICHRLKMEWQPAKFVCKWDHAESSGAPALWRCFYRTCYGMCPNEGAAPAAIQT